MIGGNFPNISFETFYVSKEEPNNVLIPEIVRIGKKFKKMNLFDESSGIISLSYGKRVLINGNVEDISNIKRKELFEIVDYDPVKNNLLIIGVTEPRLETPVHWMIHHARSDVNIVIQINNLELVEKLQKKIVETEKDYLPGTFDQIKDVLSLLHDNKKLIIKNQGVLFVGNSIKEAEELVVKTVEGVK
jgi:ribulose-5-phosphate 4-epimerase/fuculose-1-phosphate aldolase